MDKPGMEALQALNDRRLVGTSLVGLIRSGGSGPAPSKPEAGDSELSLQP